MTFNPVDAASIALLTTLKGGNTKPPRADAAAAKSITLASLPVPVQNFLTDSQSFAKSRPLTVGVVGFGGSGGGVTGVGSSGRGTVTVSII
ncbi:MAG: hypothetical protein EAZ09_16200 [Oscillatoriales cyanobacterium]|nr:MAG: hypothetical protein EAZ09_16200 [Oscillatoriales cyanobacterium]